MAALTNQPYPVDTPTQDQTKDMARMIHSHDETVDQTTVLPKMEHIRGEKNLPYKKVEQQGGGFVTNQDHGEAFPSKLAATGLTQYQFSDDEYLTGGGSEPQVPMAGNQDAFELTGSLKRPPPVAMTGNPKDFKPPAQRPPETAFPKSDYRYDRDFQPPAPSPPEAALQKGDHRYNRQETTQTRRLFEDGELGKSAERHGHARRRRDRSPHLQGLHRADIPLVSNFGSPGDRTPSAVERLW